MTATQQERDAKIERLENIAARVATRIRKAATAQEAQQAMRDGLRDIDAQYHPDTDDLDLNVRVEKAYWAAQATINAAYDALSKS